MITKALTSCDGCAECWRSHRGVKNTDTIPEWCKLQDAEVVEWKDPEKGEFPEDLKRVWGYYKQSGDLYSMFYVTEHKLWMWDGKPSRTPYKWREIR